FLQRARLPLLRHRDRALHTPVRPRAHQRLDGAYHRAEVRQQAHPSDQPVHGPRAQGVCAPRPGTGRMNAATPDAVLRGSGGIPAATPDAVLHGSGGIPAATPDAVLRGSGGIPAATPDAALRGSEGTPAAEA